MTDQETAEIRKILKEHGHSVPERGVLSAANKALYDDIISGNYSGGVSPDDFTPPGDAENDGSDYVSTASPPDPAAADVPSAAAADDDERPQETTPRSARMSGASRAREFLRDARDKTSSRPRRPRRKRTPPQVPVAPVIERLWTELAWAARKLPPIQRVMAAQAPMVGVVLDGATRDTIVGRGLLQPLARGEERLEGINAVFGPLFWTGMIVRFGGFDTEPVYKDGQPLILDGQPVVQPVRDSETGEIAWNDQTRAMIGGLRFSLMSWLRVGQRHAAEIIARAEELDELSDQADALIAFILAPPRPGQSFRDMAREARQRTGVFVHGEATGEPDEAGTAAAPAPASPGQDPVMMRAALPPSSYPYPAPAPGPDPRTLGFLPPDAAVASQVVPRAVIPQG